MITTFLDRLGTLVSRYFLVGYAVPVLVFAFLNALLLGWQSPGFRRWAPAQFEGFKGLYAVPVLVGLAVVAYLLQAVSVYLRQILEGRRLLPERWLARLAATERRRQECLVAEYERARDEF